MTSRIAIERKESQLARREDMSGAGLSGTFGARRGFAVITAVTLVGFVGVALACIAIAFATQARRSGAEAVDAQRRQLEIAGLMQANAMIAHGDVKAGDARPAALPDELTAAGAKVELRFRQSGNGGALTADVVATFGGR
jgi:hypothetical protein